MGSTPPRTAASESPQPDAALELRRLLEQREREIRTLRFELEKYKLALHQSQLDYHHLKQQQQQGEQDQQADDGSQEATRRRAARSLGDIGALAEDDNSGELVGARRPARQASVFSTDSAASSSQRVMFSTGDDHDDSDHDARSDEPRDVGADADDPTDERTLANNSFQGQRANDNLDDIMQDVGEIDLELQLDQIDAKKSQEDVIPANLFSSLTDEGINNLSQLAALQERCESQQQQHSSPQQPPTGSSSPVGASAGQQRHYPAPFSASNLASQAAIAISAAANLPELGQRPASSPSSVSPSSSIQAELGQSGQSLASVVAAAAVAAAAAATELRPTRLVSSAVASPEFYQSLQQQQHAQSPHQLLYSPSTSATPSSLLAPSRRSASNASSSLLSPVSSPSYLRRQFMSDRLPLMSPSPSSGLATGSSSGASSSLAHILQRQSQQRSASALAGGPISSPSGTPLSSAGSAAVSPLVASKHSSQARLNNMQIRHKFGYLGSGRAQFNSPHGFCLGLNQEIVVADTNNHRVCIFDKSGAYITQFGSPGKEEGQLWNPRKVAILHRPSTGDQSASPAGLTSRLSSPTYPTIQFQATGANLTSSNQLAVGGEPLYVVCDRGAERSRMQLFTKDGAFIKKIGIHYIDIVAGLAITQSGLIIVVDSVSPTVYIINGETGVLNGWFDCSGHMKEPSDIAVKSDLPGNEYFICDFKGHCVVVFSEQGEYLRKIGHDGLTSYPNGIDISDDGDILVGDSHGNRFHVVVFDRNGNFVSQFECPHVKVSRCCGLKITREGYIVTLAKNNHHVLVLDTIHI